MQIRAAGAQQSVQTTLTAKQPQTTIAQASKANADQAASLAGDQLVLTAKPQSTSLKQLAWGSGAGAASGLILGAGMGTLLPTIVPMKGVAIGAAFGAGAGVLAGASSAYVVNRWLDGKVSSTAAGAGLGLVAGAISGVAMGFALKGHTLSNAAFMAIPGAVAGAISGYTTAHIKAKADAQ